MLHIKYGPTSAAEARFYIYDLYSYGTSFQMPMAETLQGPDHFY